MATDHPPSPDPSTPLGDDPTPDPEPTDLLPAPQPPEPDPSSLPQPDPIEPRPYIEIRSSETPVDPGAVTRAFASIDQRLREYTRTGLRHKLQRTALLPVIEFLLVSDGRSDTSIRYLVGSNVTDLTEDVEGILRTCFPNTYEFRHTSYHPRFVEEHLPIVHTPDPQNRPLYDKHERDGPQHPAITPATPYVAGVEFLATCDRLLDWQTPLTPFDEFVGPKYHDRPHTESRRVPLATLIESIGDADCPVIYQVVATPYPDWSDDAAMHRKDLEDGTVTRGDKIIDFFFGDRETRERHVPPKGDQDRIDGIDRRNPAQTSIVSARAVALTRTHPSRADAIARRLAGDLTTLGHKPHLIVGRRRTDDELHDGLGSPPGSSIYDDVCSRTIYGHSYQRYVDRLRGRGFQSRGIVVDATELPGFCVLDGAGLTLNGRRAIATRPAEQTGLQLPPPAQLAHYRGPGIPLCRPLTHDRREYDSIVSVAPGLQPRHLLVCGASGAGKSVTMTSMALGNVLTTDGPAIIFDLKGDGMAEEYLKTHAESVGSLDGVAYFDLTETLPALSFFDIRPLLDAGIPRAEATSRKVGHYEEILKGVMGAEQYERAAVSRQVIATHIQALFDPIHGADAFSHRDLYAALGRTQTQKSGPPVSDADLERHFSTLIEDDPRMFANVMTGARNRVEQISLDSRLAPLFNHVPDTTDEDVPQFDFADVIESNDVVIFDFGGMEASAKRTLTMAILSSLWTALTARYQRVGDVDGPVTNVFVEEAATVADTALVDTLLSEGRSFGLSMTMGLQYPGQLKSADTDTYYETLNETATFLVGRVNVDDEVAKVFATEALPEGDVKTRLSNLGAGEWLVRLGAEYADATPRPFLATSLPAPRGHAVSAEPLSGVAAADFQAAFDACQDRTASAHGLAHSGPTATDDAERTTDGEPTDETTDPDDDPEDPPRLDSLLPYTKRLPDCIDYDEPRHAVVCAVCENRFNPTIEGMMYAIECCHSLAEVDRDDIPPSVNRLKRSIEEVRNSEWSIRAHCYVQAIFTAQQCGFHPLEYDIVYDSMLRLQEYVGIDAEEVQALLDAGLIRHDTDHPHRLYSVAPEARSMIGEAYRRGVEYGHGKGDLEESAEHVFGMEVAKRWARQVYVENAEHPGVTLSPYHELDPPTDESDQRRLDLAVLDADDDVVVAIEVERINHDYREAVPRDFDKMAACDPDEAVWIVMKQADGHKVLSALNDPPDGEPRVEKTYATTTPPQQFRLDEPGCTDILPAEYLRDNVLEPPEWLDPD